MKRSKVLLMLGAAVIGAMGASVSSAVAGPDDLVLICYRTRTIQVPSYIVSRFIFKGATAGACVTTP